MKVFLRSRSIQILVSLVFIVASVAVSLVFPVSHSHAAAPSSHEQAALAALAARLPFTLRPLRQRPHTVTVGHPNISINARNSDRLLYVDAGSCPGPNNSGDSIDVYHIFRTGLVHVGNFPTGGCYSLNAIVGGGSQDLDVTPANGTHGPCLVYTSFATGLVNSFPILPSGALGTKVSQLALGAYPIDVHIALDGKLVYTNVLSTLGSASVLISYSLGAGCVLTPLSDLVTSHLYLSMAFINASSLIGVDTNTGTIDTYSLAANGDISLFNSVPGQLSSAGSFEPISMAALRMSNGQQDVFTGQITDGVSHVQGGQEMGATGAINFLRGSPASDLRGQNGIAIFADSNHSLLIQGELGSNSLGVYSVASGPGHPGSITLLQHTPLATGGGHVPVGFALMDNTLFVAAGAGGDVETCQITSSGVSGCVTAAVLTDHSLIEGGIALL